MTEKTKLKPYFIHFAMIYLIVILVIALIPILLHIKIPQMMGTVVVMVAAMSAGQKFITDNKRVFTNSEKWSMIWGSLLLSFLISIAITAIFLATPYSAGAAEAMKEIFYKIPIAIWAGILAFISALYILGLYLGYGWITNRNFTILQKKNKI